MNSWNTIAVSRGDTALPSMCTAGSMSSPASRRASRVLPEPLRPSTTLKVPASNSQPTALSLMHGHRVRRTLIFDKTLHACHQRPNERDWPGVGTNQHRRSLHECRRHVEHYDEHADGRAKGNVEH